MLLYIILPLHNDLLLSENHIIELTIRYLHLVHTRFLQNPLNAVHQLCSPSMRPDYYSMENQLYAFTSSGEWLIPLLEMNIFLHSASMVQRFAQQSPLSIANNLRTKQRTLLLH